MANPANWALGALRKTGKSARLSCSSSDEFRVVAVALVGMRNVVASVQRRSFGDVALELRLEGLRGALALQRSLEVEHQLPHRRSLKAAVVEAASSGRFSPSAVDCMAHIVNKGNASRHRLWTRTRWKIVVQPFNPAAAVFVPCGSSLVDLSPLALVPTAMAKLVVDLNPLAEQY